MNEEDKDIDVESDEVPEVGREATATTSNSLHDPHDDGGDMHDKRAHHNALERRRRDHIKDSFHGLRDCIPSMEGEKVSRAHILNKATEYIRQMQKGGLLREVEISDLKDKNEVLEEQVRALDHATTLGTSETSDEILQTITEQIQARQQQQRTLQLQQPPRTQGDPGSATKSSDRPVGKGGKDSGKSPGQAAMSAAKFPATPAAAQRAKTPKAPAENQQNQINLNLFASNLKSAQSLLTALQKTTGGNLPANVKSLAARVLASPLRTQTAATTQPQAVPRGIVTATTVANQSASLAGFLQKQLSTTPPTVAPKSVSQPQAKPVGSTATVVSTGSASGASKNVVAPAAVPVSSVAVSSSSTASVSTVQSQKIASSLLSQSISSQLLAANSLLKQSTAAVGSEGSTPTSDVGGTSPTTLSSNQQLASELLAQVTSFLNLPTQAVAGSTSTGSDVQSGEGGEAVSLLSENGVQNDAPQESSTSTPATNAASVAGHVDGERYEGRKRVGPHEPRDGELSPKKPRIEQ